jgi:hypothetical protein
MQLKGAEIDASAFYAREPRPSVAGLFAFLARWTIVIGSVFESQLKRLINEEFIGGQRGKLASRLRALLEPDQNGVLAEKFSIEVDREILCEIVGSLYDANALESEQRDAITQIGRPENSSLDHRDSGH